MALAEAIENGDLPVSRIIVDTVYENNPRLKAACQKRGVLIF